MPDESELRSMRAADGTLAVGYSVNRPGTVTVRKSDLKVLLDDWDRSASYVFDAVDQETIFHAYTRLREAL